MKRITMPISTVMVTENEIPQLGTLRWDTNDPQIKTGILEALRIREPVELVFPLDPVHNKPSVVRTAYVTSAKSKGDSLEVTCEMFGLSPKQIEALRLHVEPSLSSCTCPVCKSCQWVIGESIFELRQFHEAGMVSVIGTIIPAVVATCHICGYLMLFNAIHVGVVKGRE